MHNEIRGYGERTSQFYDITALTNRKRYKTNLLKKRRKKVKFLKNKYRREKRFIPDETDGIIIKDQTIPDNYTTQPRIYGGVTIGESEKEAMILPPKFAMYDQINPKKCAAEVEKGLTKLRWERIQTKQEESSAGTNMNDDTDGGFNVNDADNTNNNTNNEENDDDNNTGNNDRGDSMNTIDFRKKRATDFVFNRRVYLPPPLEQDVELQLQLLKSNIKKATKEYANKVTDANNLTEKEREGIDSLKERVKNGEIVIQQTDKSGRNAIDSPANYRIFVQPHISNDEPITKEEHDELEKEMNAPAYME